MRQQKPRYSLTFGWVHSDSHYMTAWWMDHGSLITLQTLAFITVHTLLSKVGPHFHPQRPFLPSQMEKSPPPPKVFLLHTSPSACFSPLTAGQKQHFKQVFPFFFLLKFPNLFPLNGSQRRAVQTRFSSRLSRCRGLDKRLQWISGDHLKEGGWCLGTLTTLGAGCCQEHCEAPLVFIGSVWALQVQICRCFVPLAEEHWNPPHDQLGLCAVLHWQ